MKEKIWGGLEIHYWAVCHRKLWLYHHGIRMEEDSDRVLEGKILHETSYHQLKEKEFIIDQAFKIDAIDGDYIREVKMSSRMEKADRLQLLYYLYQLKIRGIQKKGLLSYTKEKKTKEVILNEKEEKEVEEAMEGVRKVTDSNKPPAVINHPYCKKCAYYSFCYAGEPIDDETF